MPRDYYNSHQRSSDEDHYKGLIGGTLRLKAWTSFMLGKIYVEAVWIDEPMYGLKDWKDQEIQLEGFTLARTGKTNSRHDVGIRGGLVELPQDILDPAESEDNIRHNDMEILKEIIFHKSLYFVIKTCFILIL